MNACANDDCDQKRYGHGLCRKHYRAKRRAEGLDTKPHDAPRLVECVVCGTIVQRHVRKGRRATCSYACRQWLTFGTGARTDLPAGHWARWYGATSQWSAPAPPATRTIRCELCQEDFVVPYWKATRKACDECRAERDREKRRAAKHRRRAKKRQAYVADVSPSRIYRRDDWRCHLCGEKVRRNKAAPHPLAPTIDHVIPLAAGGTHEPANCATAHFVCNARKGSRGGGEQLALIG